MSLLLEFLCDKTYLECDSVVNDHGFPKHIGRVLRVGELCVQVKSEVGVIVHLFVSQDHKLSSLTSCEEIFRINNQ